MPSEQDQVKVKTYREAGLTVKFANLVVKRQEANKRKTEAEAEVKALSTDILEMLSVSGEKTVLTDNWRVTFTPGCNVTINKLKLLEQGVSVKIIEKATIRKDYETVTITPLKEKS